MKTIYIRTRTAMAAVLTALFLFSAGAAAAQESRSLRIVDGEVYVDDRSVPQDELPEGLRLEGLTVHYTFSGDVRPVVQLGEQFYVLDGDRLRVAEPAERDGSFFQRPPRIRNLAEPDVQVQFRTDPVDPPAPPHAVLFNRKAEELRERAVRLHEIQRTIHEKFGEQHIGEMERLAQEMSLHAAEAAQMASDLPRVELETYLEDLRRRNDGLFDRLVSERQLEQQTIQMARQIRQMAEQERIEEVQALRTQLEQIFELKQENRRREVQQLERRLEDLEQKLTERERLREEIVERRLEELLDETERDW